MATGRHPAALDAIHRAIELNGVAIDRNKQAFDLGRLALADPEQARTLAGADAPVPLDTHREQTAEQIVARRVEELTGRADAA
ncbi:hypothetical protein KBY27_11710 [Ruegeria pomeroyi]|uniref:Uncharacterized protein n=1 Tax=Ruegeria pomeroyi TaxID=89184 RepID=A0A9Q3WLQ6_9RHOB|nr:hypothetical protein [Ruegeria pomeroyi]MCE8538120.1 hypothetical protein [Ruegeria pomeroyi]